jgi:hypothetical protein
MRVRISSSSGWCLAKKGSGASTNCVARWTISRVLPGSAPAPPAPPAPGDPAGGGAGIPLRGCRWPPKEVGRGAAGSAFPLQAVYPLPYRRQQQVDDGLIQEVDVVYVEHAPVGGSQEPRLKNRFPCLTEASTSTDPSSRSSVTPKGTWTKGGAITWVGGVVPWG